MDLKSSFVLESDLSVGRNARGIGSEVEFLVKKSDIKKPECVDIPKGVVRFEHLILRFEIRSPCNRGQRKEMELCDLGGSTGELLYLLCHADHPVLWST
jgi:hypothetical protein